VTNVYNKQRILNTLVVNFYENDTTCKKNEQQDAKNDAEL
jgi:hypothetical protein